MKIFKKQDTSFVGSLMGLTGEYADAIFRLDKDETIVIGRDPKTSHIVFDEGGERISRTHCSITCDSASGNYIVCDQSTNGTFVDGQRVPPGVPYEVPRGSILALGNNQNTFRLN